jgi:ribonuclease HII
MKEIAHEYPQYHWENNAGYLTKEHLNAIDTYGLTKYHRPSFLKKHFEKQLSLF